MGERTPLASSSCGTALRGRAERTEAAPPLGVRAGATIGFAQAAIAACAALLLFAARNDRAALDRIGVSQTTVTRFALVWLILAAITAVAAAAVWRRGQKARPLMALGEALQFGAGIYLLVFWGGIYVSSAMILLMVGSLSLWLLYGRSDRFFARRDASLPS
jgi:hypothetical protein